MSVRKKFEKLTVNPNLPDEAEQAGSASETKKRRVYAFRPAAKKSGTDKVYAVGFIRVYVLFAVVFGLAALYHILSEQGLFDSLADAGNNVARAGVLLCIYLVPTLVYVLFIQRNGSSGFGFHRFSPAYTSFLVLGLFLTAAIVSAEKFSLAYFFSVVEESKPVQLSWDNPFPVLLAHVAVPALCEELFLRGVLQTELSRLSGGLTGMTVSALAYALLHFNAPYFIVYLTAGIFLAIAMHVCGSVIPCILLNAANRFVSLLFSVQLTFIASERAGNAFVLIVLLLAVFLLTLFYIKSLEVLCTKKAISADLQTQANQEASPAQGKTNAPVTKEPPLPESENIIRFRSTPFRLYSDTGYTFHKFFRVLFSPALILAVIVFFMITFL